MDDEIEEAREARTRYRLDELGAEVSWAAQEALDYRLSAERAAELSRIAQAASRGFREADRRGDPDALEPRLRYAVLSSQFAEYARAAWRRDAQAKTSGGARVGERIVDGIHHLTLKRGGTT